MGKNGIEVKGTMDFASVVSFLEDVVSSFKERKVVVQSGDRFISMEPTDNINVEVEASEKKGKQKFSIELEWREEVDTPSGTPFKVSSTEPEAPKEEPEAKSEASAEKEAERTVLVSVCKTSSEDAKKDAAAATPPAKEEPKAPAKEETKNEPKTPAKGGAKGGAKK